MLRSGEGDPKILVDRVSERACLRVWHMFASAGLVLDTLRHRSASDFFVKDFVRRAAVPADSYAPGCRGLSSALLDGCRLTVLNCPNREIIEHSSTVELSDK